MRHPTFGIQEGPGHHAVLVAIVAFASLAACKGRVARTATNDASSQGDGGASNVPYWQWWDPQCGPPGSPCTNPSCTQVPLQASPVGGCAVGTSFMTGCLLDENTGGNGWLGFTSTDHQRIDSYVSPYTTTGLTSCTDPYCTDQGCCPCPWLDGGVTADAGPATNDASPRSAVDASDVPYWQWWAAQCGSPGSTCTEPGCAQVWFTASPVGGCEVGKPFATGCMPNLVSYSSSTYYSSSADRRVVQTLISPATMTGLTQCGFAGGTPPTAACCPWFHDGG